MSGIQKLKFKFNKVSKVNNYLIQMLMETKD
jgi:hypothetical protein